MKKIILLIFAFISIAIAATGQVNIFTGDPAAEIYVDGDFLGKEQVLKHTLEEGTHYLQIKKGGKVLRSQAFNVTAGKLETVVVENFVDYRTNVANRGAIEVEASRVRETRGNVAFGLHGGSPASGLSLKWWPTEKVGLQVIGYINDSETYVDSRGGTRLLYSFSESVYKGSVLTIYGAIGSGRSMLRSRVDGNKNEIYELTEGAFGLEFKIADLFNQPQEQKHVVIDDDTNPLSVVLTQLIIYLGEAFISLSHYNLELGVERVLTRYYNDEETKAKIAGKVSGGLHFYF